MIKYEGPVVPILYEDDNFLVINKPAGLIVHPDGKTVEPTLVDWILKKYPKLKKVGEPLVLSTGVTIWRPGIVHRIDRDTTGCLLIAKSQEAYLHAKNQFKERTVHKSYRAFVYGVIKDDRGIVNRPIGRSATDFRRWSVGQGIRGEVREAKTTFVILKRFRECTYIQAIPHTGRTHQIRVHMKSVQHPVVCDRLYAPTKEPMLGFTRLALHAFSLEFVDMEGKTRRIEAPLPADFENALGFAK